MMFRDKNIQENRHAGITVLVGNPFYATGRGGTLVSFFRSFKAIGLEVGVCDAYSRWNKETIDQEVVLELKSSLLRKPGRSINIYHVNAEEVDLTQSLLKNTLPDGAYNILYPFWELSRYPEVWLDKLNLFDELWAPSRFIEGALQGSVDKPISHMPLPIKVELIRFLGRSRFKIPPLKYTFLFSFDFRSYIERKNPYALIEVFKKVKAERPLSDFNIVIKAQGSGNSAKTRQDYEEFVLAINESPVRDNVMFINELFTDYEMKNLIRCCDCYISLHRSEGFGLGMAEAMFLGKPVIATGYSGNMDFMDEQTALIVNYKLKPVGRDEYLFAENQQWAEPDLDQAAFYVLKLLDDPEFGRRLGKKASQHIRINFSYLAMGLKYHQRLEEIRRERAQ